MKPVRWTCPHCKVALISSPPESFRNSRIQPDPAKLMKMLCSSCKTESKMTWAALTSMPESKPQQSRIQTPPAFKRKFPAPMQEVPQQSFAHQPRRWVQATWITLSMATVSLGLIELKPTQNSAPVRAPAHATASVAAKPTLTASQAPIIDSIETQSMAPTRPRIIEGLGGLKKAPLFLQARDGLEDVPFRRGPGTDFAQVGQADPYLQYKVKEWRGRWFEIETDEVGKKTAWVNLDQVEVISEGNHESK